MPRIFAILTDTICIICAINYALVARHPLVDILVLVAVICALQLLLILGGGFIPKNILRYIRPVARIGNLGLGFILLPLGVIVLSVITDKNNADGVAGIIMICAMAGIVLLMIIFNRSLTKA